jgi:hypothetical protein
MPTVSTQLVSPPLALLWLLLLYVLHPFRQPFVVVSTSVCDVLLLHASYTTTCTGRPCSAARLRDEERVQRLGTRGREPLEVGPAGAAAVAAVGEDRDVDGGAATHRGPAWWS